MKTPRELQSLYEQGHNISAILRTEMGVQKNTQEIIEISYDLQTGSYISAMENAEKLNHKSLYSQEIAQIILSLCEPRSILEAGVGEATTLSGVIANLRSRINPASYGFDLSWSRAAYASYWLNRNGIVDTRLCTGDLCNIPFLDNSIDVVYTSHSIEPNGGKEETILRELYRVTRKYLILLEPGYELASDEAKQRMESHGYCRNLTRIAQSLDYNVLEHKLFPFSVNPLNPTALTIIRKNSDMESSHHNIFACPKYKSPLEEIGGMLFSPEALVVYPVIAKIPCLRVENGVFASRYKEIMLQKTT